MDALYSINELREVAAAALSAIGYTPPDSARVRAVPDTRTIRYYTTLGLIDRPAELRGRTAFYSRRHVLQIVAIKKRQTEDRTLSDIQAELAGMTNADLQKFVNLPKAFWEEARQPKAPQASSSDTLNEPEFWATLPSPICDEPNNGDSSVNVQSCLRLNLHPCLQLIVSLSTQRAKSFDPGGIDHKRLNHAASLLINELTRQKLLSTSDTRDARHLTS